MANTVTFDEDELRELEAEEQVTDSEASEVIGAGLGAIVNPTAMLEQVGGSLQSAGRTLGEQAQPYLQKCFIAGLIEGLADTATAGSGGGSDLLSNVVIPDFELPESPRLSAPIAALKAATES